MSHYFLCKLQYLRESERSNSKSINGQTYCSHLKVKVKIHTVTTKYALTLAQSNKTLMLNLFDKAKHLKLL